ncbi:MBL fold metallo-hydrolase [uncultured Paraglaciecola sp.]|uniref:MBL fold metallo-hydrolase n=1 Tax=uncultured Paraglaciecola sp. TaxID=1765024 RepID=UPI00261F122B|nr:MBL fold metallo-hydrolase [uncultured Paraglaciecola sp.]
MQASHVILTLYVTLFILVDDFAEGVEVKTVKFIALGLVLFGAVLFFNREAITLKLMEKTIDKNLTSNLLSSLPDGLHVYLCGAGSPMMDVKRSGPCTAVMAGNRVFIVDTGSSASKVLQQGRVPQANIEAVFLTHFHSDHIDGLGELIMQRWANGAHTTPLAVIAPKGVEQVVAGFNQAYAQDDAYRIAHHTAKIMPPTGSNAAAQGFELPESGQSKRVYEQDGLVVTAFKVEHEPVSPAVGYKFEYRGRSVVISGDTVKSTNIAKFAAGVDVLLHEALSKELVLLINQRAKAAGRANIAKITHDILDYHASPVDAAQTAQQAKVGHLVLHHIVPPLPISTLESIFVKGVSEAYSGDFTLGKDGTFISLPAESKEIKVQELIW